MSDVESGPFRQSQSPRVTEPHARELLKRTMRVLETISAMPTGTWGAVADLKRDIVEAP